MRTAVVAAVLMASTVACGSDGDGDGSGQLDEEALTVLLDESGVDADYRRCVLGERSDDSFSGGRDAVLACSTGDEPRVLLAALLAGPFAQEVAADVAVDAASTRFDLDGYLECLTSATADAPADEVEGVWSDSNDFRSLGDSVSVTFGTDCLRGQMFPVDGLDAAAFFEATVERAGGPSGAADDGAQPVPDVPLEVYGVLEPVELAVIQDPVTGTVVSAGLTLSVPPTTAEVDALEAMLELVDAVGVVTAPQSLVADAVVESVPSWTICVSADEGVNSLLIATDVMIAAADCGS